MKKIIMTFDRPGGEAIGIIYNSVDVHALDTECLSHIETEYYATQDYSRFEGHWFFEDDAAYENWYAEFGLKRDGLLASFLEYLEVHEVIVKTYSEIENSRMPDALPFDQYVELPKLIRVK
jgi:hypothetical protein